MVVSQKQYRKGWNSCQEVGAGNLAGLILGALDVDDVIDQLEGNANALAKLL